MNPPAAEPEIIEADAIPTVVAVFENHPMDIMSVAFDETYQVLFPTLNAKGITPIGPGFALYTSVPTDTVSFEVGIPVNQPLDGDVSANNGIVLKNSELPGGKIARISHHGSYDGLGQAWPKFLDAVSASGHVLDTPFWEVYVTEPSPELDPATLQTDLYTKLK
ncbi:GyrI-like domain-containing protein [Corynebacterium suranareeae]|nr:GyrI-like domain-containing protein [Corynebacterium suranareeae]